jgi:16S rRNA C1402 N4-methylase RsmH
MSLVQKAQQLVSTHLSDGDIAVDATVGNGHDTLFLAQTVGNNGKVYGFDIQQTALDNCYQRLQQHHLNQRVALIHAGHETMPIALPKEVCDGAVKAIMFNLGYLPGSDKSRTTRSATTLSALNSATQILAPNGIITILAYTGHPGGKQEAESVKAWTHMLFNDAFSVSVQLPRVSSKPAPELISIVKM